MNNDLPFDLIINGKKTACFGRPDFLLEKLQYKNFISQLSRKLDRGIQNMEIRFRCEDCKWHLNCRKSITEKTFRRVKNHGKKTNHCIIMNYEGDIPYREN